jgi:ATP-dependent protease ClpP protease subunit
MTGPDLKALKRRKMELEIARLEADLIVSQVLAEDATREERLSESSDWWNGVFYFTSDVDNASVKELMLEISEFRRYAPRKPITLYLNSDGGLNTAGLHLYAFLSDIPKLTIHVRGWAASMATVILQAAKTRRIDREAHLMIHKSGQSLPWMGADNAMLEAEVTMAWSKQTIRILASRSNLTERELDLRTKHRDWYLTATEALHFGLVDELV